MSAATIERLNAALSDRYRIDREIGSGGIATVTVVAFAALLGLPPAPQLRSALFDRIRDDPRFQALLERHTRGEVGR